MKRMGWIGLVLGLFLSGCMSTPPLLSRAVVRNQTAKIIEDVSMSNPETLAGASVSAILPGSELEIGLSPRSMVAESALVRWRTGSTWHEEVVKLPEAPSGDEPVVVVIRISDSEPVSARIRTDKKY
jgi:hypothetical protein